MSVWATVNGIDVVLFVLAAIGFTGWAIERSEYRTLERCLDEVPEDEAEFPSNVTTICSASSHYEMADGFTGRGKPVKESRPRMNPPQQEQTCLLVHKHEGPHMGTSAVWE